MENLHDVIAYILKEYPVSSHLSNSRLTKLIYLSDWKCAIEYNEQMTGIEWYFDYFGPFVWDVKKEIEEYPQLFRIDEVTNFYGSDKKQIVLIDSNYIPQLIEEHKIVIDKIINTTKEMMWEPFIKLVYSTYPILCSRRFTHLDLVAKAKDYKLLKESAPRAG